MQIVEDDFILEPDIYGRYNLTFMKKVKKRDTGKMEIEPGNTMYSMTLSSSLLLIAKHRTAKKFKEENTSLMNYLKELQKSYLEVIKLCRESIPEKFDTGD